MEKEENSGTRKLQLRALLKGSIIIIMAPLMVLAILVFWGKLLWETAILAALGIFALSVLFVRPYLTNLKALTDYVTDLSLDKKANPPDLTFLNNVEELSEAVRKLQDSWEIRRRQLEARVAESRILIDTLPDILIMLDRDRNIIQTNSTAKGVFGGKYFKDNLKRIVEDPNVQEKIAQVMSSKKIRDMEFFMGEPFNRHYILRLNHFPIYSPGGISLIIVMHDISEQKHTEQMLSDFVANASHEIRTPLTTVIGLIETLQTTAKNDENAREEFLKVMQGQSERMAKLVKDLLSLSQIERNLHTKPTDKIGVPAIMEEVCRNMKMNAEEKQMNIEFNVSNKLPKVPGDKGQISQVFENLVSNAIKYGYKSTSIKVDVNVVKNNFPEETSLREYDNIMAVSVTNMGDGIEAKHIPRLTERFYRIDSARSRKISGTGLGLAIVKQILERHSGALKIESVFGESATFKVLLPVD